MAETPEAIVAAWIKDGFIVTEQSLTQLARQVWLARGQADQDAAVTRMSTLVGWASSEPYLKHIREAIAALDR